MTAMELFEAEQDPETSEATKDAPRDLHYMCLKKDGILRLSRGIKDGKLRWVFSVKQPEGAGSSRRWSSPVCMAGITEAKGSHVGKTCVV